ncbi:MAG: pyridoxal 5'-phosphate synthase glutaminase subunit PdxT [Deltaproteobacteria bacterium]|jgi:5'-phosphate synthase pdxT subunit|nr:pyridoxal 5'-phosphate synthase glutaminase subunit PdxT [Deltaproteobacteria bacterium]
MPARVGILAIQGDVEAHATALAAAGAEAVQVLREKDLDGLAGLILPGGESTTISKGMDRLGLWEPVREFAASGRPVLGTCAGAILLARETVHHPVPTLGLLDAVAVRNAYGTQVDSFAAPVDPGARHDLEGLRCVFIRAPQLEQLGPGVEVYARVDGRPVLVRQANLWAATFHPELTADPRIHQLLLPPPGQLT